MTLQKEIPRMTERFAIKHCPKCLKKQIIHTQIYNERIEYVAFKCCKLIRCYDLEVA